MLPSPITPIRCTGRERSRRSDRRLTIVSTTVTSVSEIVQHPCVHAAERPDQPAVIMGGSGEVLTYGQLEDASNRMAHLLRAAGLQRGDHVAVLLTNRPEWYPVVWGAMRSGALRHAGQLAPDRGRGRLHRRPTAGRRPSWSTPSWPTSWRQWTPTWPASRPASSWTGWVATPLASSPTTEVVAAHPVTRIGDESEGAWMLYSSGTTGRPKGIEPRLPEGHLGAPSSSGCCCRASTASTPTPCTCSPAPLYHAAPRAGRR